jgi:tRNA threonylcarbamoyladenosine biosynthesis protein TsaE
MKTLTKKIVSPVGTAKLAKELAGLITAQPSKKGARVVALQGELGAGKTTFTKSFLKALGVTESVTSPTFILFRPYPLDTHHISRITKQESQYTLAYHIDCYRLEDPKELLKLGLKEMLKNSKYIVLIEWAERVKKFLPKNIVWISIKHGVKKGSRTFTVKGL